MSQSVPLTPGVAAGVPPEELVTEVPTRYLLPTGRRAVAVALIESWLADADRPGQREAADALVRGLDANRPGERPLFPPELEGATW